MNKIRHVSLKRESGQPEPPDLIAVKLKNGAIHTIEVSERHTLKTKSEIYAKYIDCATMALSGDRAERLSDFVDRLEALSEVSTLMNLITGESLKTS
jgi:hypothetical protein